jgi:L-methionine (R)-S-oxide reductase
MTVPVLDSGKVIAALRGAFAREVSREELLRTAAEKIRASGPPYTSVYLYMLQGQDLVLEAHAGRETEHTRIPVGVGVCGTAVASGLDQNVPDVTAVGNYLACNVWTRSELVVLIRRGASILGQIDVDSDVPNPFTPEEESAVKQVADALAVLL